MGGGGREGMSGRRREGRNECEEENECGRWEFF